MMVEEEPGVEETVEAEELDVELHADVDDDDDVVEAHTWRAQS